MLTSLWVQDNTGSIPVQPLTQQRVDTVPFFGDVEMNYIVSGTGVMTIVVDNKSYTVGYDHPNYMAIKECVVNNDESKIEELIDIPSAIEDYAEGKVTVTDGVLRYDGEEIHNSLTDRIMGMMRTGFPFEPMIKFLANVLENHSNRAVQELYTFLEHKNLPITEDGCFLAYKAVTDDYKDKWTGEIDNSVGQTVSMQRRKVNDDCGVGCSDGLHCGALEYVESYRAEHAGDRVVIVKVNPKDVVSVPTDCECQKVRTCEYQVIADYEGPLKSLLHSSEDGDAWTPEQFADFMHTLMSQDNDSDSDYDFDSEDEGWKNN